MSFQADEEVVLLMERLRVDICTDRPLTGNDIGEDSLAQVTHLVRGLDSEKINNA